MSPYLYLGVVAVWVFVCVFLCVGVCACESVVARACECLSKFLGTIHVGN